MEITIIFFVALEIFLLVIIYLVFINSRKIRKQIKELGDSADIKRVDIYDAAAFKELPEPVQRYFSYALKDGQRFINIVKISQSGSIRLKDGQKWLQFKAVQHFSGRLPAFIWIASIKTSPFAWVNVIDRYLNSRANMIFRLFSLLTTVRATGLELEASSLVRYISEAPWFPTSLLPSKFLSWEPVNKNSATAMVRYGQVKAMVTFHFKDNGEIAMVHSTDRFRFADGEYRKENWNGYFKNYVETNGIKLPTEMEAEWNLESGNFKYFKNRLERIEYI